MTALNKSVSPTSPSDDIEVTAGALSASSARRWLAVAKV